VMSVKKEIRFAAELRKAASGRTLRGYAAKFSERSVPLPGAGGVFIEQLAPGCFSECLAGDGEIRALVDHDHTKILARRSNGSLRISEDSVGLAVQFDVPNTTWGNDLLACVDSGLIRGMSFQMWILNDSWGKTVVDGKELALRTVQKAYIDEVTCTSMPAYPSTTLSARSYFPDGLPASVEARSKLAAPPAVAEVSEDVVRWMKAKLELSKRK
jgi:HK97 family phage prohead protease